MENLQQKQLNQKPSSLSPSEVDAGVRLVAGSVAWVHGEVWTMRILVRSCFVLLECSCDYRPAPPQKQRPIRRCWNHPCHQWSAPAPAKNTHALALLWILRSMGSAPVRRCRASPRTMWKDSRHHEQKICDPWHRNQLNHRPSQRVQSTFIVECRVSILRITIMT